MLAGSVGLRRALADNWANIRYRLVDVAENRHIRETLMCPGKSNTQREDGENVFLALRKGIWTCSYQGSKSRQAGHCSGVFCIHANKRLVLTLPTRDSFGIIARHKSLGGGVGFVLPVRAQAGRTNEALGGW